MFERYHQPTPYGNNHAKRGYMTPALCVVTLQPEEQLLACSKLPPGHSRTCKENGVWHVSQS